MDLGYHNFRHTHIGTLTLSTRTSKYFRSEARNGPGTIGNHFSCQRCRHWVGKASQSTVCFGVSFIFKLCIHFSSSSIPRLALVSDSLALLPVLIDQTAPGPPVVALTFSGRLEEARPPGNRQDLVMACDRMWPLATSWPTKLLVTFAPSKHGVGGYGHASLIIIGHP